MRSVNHKIVKLGLVLVVFCTMVIGILAGTGKPVASQEEELSAWAVRCSETSEQASGQPRCEMYQRLVVQETGQRVAEFAIGYPADSQKARGVVILPLGILLTEGAQMQIDDHPAFSFKIRYCTQEGCYAFLNMNSAVLDMMRKGKVANVSFMAAEGKTIKLQLSLSGFTKSIEQIS
jgi:invasion protein IalB